MKTFSAIELTDEWYYDPRRDQILHVHDFKVSGLAVMRERAKFPFTCQCGANLPEQFEWPLRIAHQDYILRRDLVMPSTTFYAIKGRPTEDLKNQMKDLLARLREGEGV